MSRGSRLWASLQRPPYHVLAHGLARTCGSLDGVRAIYARQSFAHGDYAPGRSDIDLFLLIDELSESGELALLPRLWWRYLPFRIAGRAFRRQPGSIVGEIEMGTPSQLASWMRIPGLRQAESRRWRPLAGRDERPAPPEAPTRVEVFNDVMLIYAVALSHLLFAPRVASVTIARVFLKLERALATLHDEPREVLRTNLWSFLGGLQGGPQSNPELAERLQRGLQSHPYEPRDLAFLSAHLLRTMTPWAERLAAAHSRPSPAREQADLEECPTRSLVQRQLTGFTTAARRLSFVEEVILSNGIMGSSNLLGDGHYKIYVVLTDDVAPDRFYDCVLRLRRLYHETNADWPWRHLSLLGHPIVLTRALLSYVLLCANPLEHWYVRRHAGVSLARAPTATALARSLQHQYAYQWLFQRSIALEGLAPWRRRSWGSSAAFTDLLYTLLAYRHYFCDGHVTTTSAEALAGCDACPQQPCHWRRDLAQLSQALHTPPGAAPPVWPLYRQFVPFLREHAQMIEHSDRFREAVSSQEGGEA